MENRWKTGRRLVGERVGKRVRNLCGNWWGNGWRKGDKLTAVLEGDEQAAVVEWELATMVNGAGWLFRDVVKKRAVKTE